MEKGLNLNAVQQDKIINTTDFTQEIKHVRNTPDTSKNPAKNQKELLPKVLKTLISQYPNVLLQGETGIGKSLTLDFIIELLTDSKKFNQTIPELSKQEQALFNQIKNKIKGNLPTAYLTIPDFSNPRKVTPIPYTDKSQLEKDSELFDNVSIKIADYMQSFAIENFELIKKNQDQNNRLINFKNSTILNNFKDGLETILTQDPQFTQNKIFQNWGNNLQKYITQSKKSIESEITKITKTIEQINTHNKKCKNEDDKINTLEFLKQFIGFVKNREDENIDRKELRRQLEFKLDFGAEQYLVNDILISDYLEIISLQNTDELNCVEFSELKAERFIAKITGEKSDFPPHRGIEELGDIFGGSILYIKDNFKGFIDQITKGENKQGKETFLEYLQTGIYSINKNGINYSFDIPRIILGCDNTDVFTNIENGGKITREHGLEARITTIQVPEITINNQQTRQDSIYVILQEIEKFNQQNNQQIQVDDESINAILNSTIEDSKALSLKYRELSIDIIQKVMSDALANGENTVTINTLKQFELEKCPKTSNHFTDSNLDNYETKILKESSPGQVNGLSYTGEYNGSNILIKSKLTLDYGKRTNQKFQLSDIDSNLAKEDTHKGFTLAKQYITNFLSQIEDKQLLSDKFNWYVSTQFNRTYGMGGPSASAAITAAIISELAQRPIHNNRHITGTIEPEGTIGEIGGIYTKASAPHRIKQLTGIDQTIIFPASNIQEMQNKLIIDPLEIQKSINLIPVENFNQAYALLTNPEINNQIIQCSDNIGKTTLKQDILNIEDRLKQNYKPTKSFFSFLK
jgi:predicted ATP-dependent protease